MIDRAVSAFLLEVVATHGEPADIICSKVGRKDSRYAGQTADMQDRQQTDRTGSRQAADRQDRQQTGSTGSRQTGQAADRQQTGSRQAGQVAERQDR